MTAHLLTLERVSALGVHAEPNTTPATLVMDSQQLNNTRNQQTMTSTQEMPRSLNEESQVTPRDYS